MPSSHGAPALASPSGTLLMPLDLATLSDLDAHGYTVLEALTLVDLPGTTYARPGKVVCIDGKSYWVKGQSQRGLVAELIAGRLAAKVSAGPVARVIRMTPR